MSFLEFTCVQCTRRLSRLLAQSSSKSSNNLILRLQVTPPRLPRKFTPLLTPRRRYGTTPSQGIKLQLITRKPPAKVRFTRADLPPLAFWDVQARALLVTDLSAEECLQAAEAYVDAALGDAPGWRKRLIATSDSPTTAQSPDGRGSQGEGNGKNKTVSAYTLHYVAVLIATGPAGEASHIALHILHTLTRLDYAPSILTLARMALRRKLLGQPQFDPAARALERMLRRIDDGSSGSESGGKSASKDGITDLAADACTLSAMIHAAEDTREGDNNALRWFRRAYEVDAAAAALRPSPTTAAQEGGKVDGSASFNPHWQWKLSFALGVAAIRVKRGETAKARDMYAIASTELDSATGYFEMAKLLEKMGKADTDEYAAALEKAATSGDPQAARRMAEMEWRRAAEGGLGKWERRKRQVLAEEWMAIAGVSAPAEG
ncbi:hypothetical protein F5B18DRAFT_624818 [Nemania serpens]|nr:hypothetical protein F5B18DRAFT_624818 [Nemania serpens]